MDQNQFNMYGDGQQNNTQPETPNADAPKSETPPPYGQGANPNPYGNTGFVPPANGQNPYGNTGYTGSANGQNPQYTGNPYGQNPYGNNGYAGNNPYGQNPQYNGNPYAQNPNGYNGYTGNNPYGQNPYYTSSPYGQNTYGQQPYNPYNAPYGRPNPAYTRPYAPVTAQDLAQRQQAKKKIQTLSKAHGLAVLGFGVFAIVLAIILRSIPGFLDAYLDNQMFQSAFDTVYAIVIIFVPFLLAGMFLKKRGLLGDLPLGTAYQPKTALPLVFVGLAACIAGSYATSIFGSMVESIFGVHFTMPEDDTVINSVPMFLLTALGTAVIPALVEEFAIRGVVMQSLRKYGDKFAIVMSAVVFALMHGNMVQIPFAFIAGLAIGYAVVVTGTMWTGVAIHFLNNFVSVIMQTAIDNLSDDQSTMVVLGLVLGIFVVGGICAILYAKMSSRTQLSKGEAFLPTAEKNKAYLCTVPMILAILYLVVETAQYVEFY